MNKCLEYIIKNRRSDYRANIAALLVINKNKRIGPCMNSYTKTNPLSIQLYPNEFTISTHAEVRAISFALKNKKFDINKSTLYIAGCSRKGNYIVSSKPCKSCQQLIEKVGIKRIVWMERRNNEYILKYLLTQ